MLSWIIAPEGALLKANSPAGTDLIASLQHSGRATHLTAPINFLILGVNSASIPAEISSPTAMPP